MRTYILIFFSLIPIIVFANDAKDYSDRALKELQERNFEKAADLFDSAFVVSGNHQYLYEKALVYYKRKKFQKVVDIIETFIDKDSIEKFDVYYQLLGSAHDFLGNKQRALRVLYSGLLLFGDSGRLYYELGVTEYGQKNIAEAVRYWDEGVVKDPSYPNNYFQLMKETFQSERKVYSMIFAELFLNLPAPDQKKMEASSLIYKVYEEALSSINDSNEPKFTDYTGDYDSESAAEYPFRIAFQQIANQVIEENTEIFNKEKEIATFEKIVAFRLKFIDKWFEKGYNELFPNPLYEYHKRLRDNKLLEAYSYFVLSSGNQMKSQEWLTENREIFSGLLNWLNENPIDLNTFVFNTSIYLQN